MNYVNKILETPLHNVLIVCQASFGAAGCLLVAVIGRMAEHLGHDTAAAPEAETAVIDAIVAAFARNRVAPTQKSTRFDGDYQKVETKEAHQDLTKRVRYDYPDRGFR